MTTEAAIAQHHFELHKQALNHSLEYLETYKKVNEFLTENDWWFISPLFFQGGDLEYFFALSKKQGNQKAEVNRLITNKFYNLNWTASFIDGYCKRCPHIKPFLKSIEHSVILTFQRDYEGSIKTIIPIIEGVLRLYLKKEKNELGKIPFITLKKGFKFLQDDVIDSFEKRLSIPFYENSIKISFSENQLKELVDLETEYTSIWFSFVRSFVNDSFYKQVNSSGDITNELNRHSILHELGLNNKYDLESFLKVYFLLHFMTWAFLRKEDKSVLNEISGFRVFEKVTSYQKIIELSKELLYEKHLLLKDYEGYNTELLRENFRVHSEKLLPYTKMLQHKALKKIDKYLWKKKYKY